MAKIFDLWYGRPGSGKSRSIIKFIQHVYETTGKKTRVRVADGSRIMYENAGLIDEGIVQLVEFGHLPEPFSVCQQLCEGMWPEDVNNPKSKMRPLTQKEIADVGLDIFEGVTVMGDYMLGPMVGGLADRAAKGIDSLGQDAHIRFVDPESGLAFGGNSPANYGTAQKHILANIRRSKGFPGAVIWTGHERYDDGERGGAVAKGQTAEKYKMTERAIGPDAAGKALTQGLAKEFGNTLHFMVASKKVQKTSDKHTGKTEYVDDTDYRVYTRNHFDPDGIVAMEYIAVTRANDPTKVAPYYSSPATDPGVGVLELYQALKAANNGKK